MPSEFDSQRLDGFLEFVSECTRIRTYDALLQVLAERANRILEFERLNILLCDEQRRILRVLVIEDHAAREVRADQVRLPEMDLMLQVLVTGAAASGSVGMSTPMQSGGRMVGTLGITARCEEYSDQEIRLVHFLGNCLAGTFERLGHDGVSASPRVSGTLATSAREAAVAANHDVTLRMSYLAQHDALTDLPNRLLLNDRLTRALASSIRYERRLAVLFLDLDRFKEINDSLGHAIGDQVLREIANRVVRCVRSSDTVSRLGGDEFVVLLAELARPEDAAISAGKIIAAIAAPLHIAGHDVHVTLSIGVSVYPGDGQDAATLIKNADTAMYHAKAEGLGKCQFFREDMNILALERQILEDGLRRALKQQEFVLHYQPKVDLDTGAIVGSEALIRWLHPDRGLLLPAQFLPIAEQSGLIVPIGQWVMRETCRQAQAWLDEGLPALPVSVNVSSAELLRKNFLENVRQILDQSRLQARFLDLELTEGVLMKQTGYTKSILQVLRTMGMKLTVDNFGTGLSSLSYLTQFPIDALKVDPSFIQQLTPDSNGGFSKGTGMIISTVIGLGKNLGHRVIAVGVETSEQLAFLQTEHCREGQGNYFSPPLPPEQFVDVLARRNINTVN